MSNGQLAELQHRIEKLQSAVMILAAAVNSRHDRATTLDESPLGIAIDLMQEGDIWSAVRLYETRTGRH